MNVFEFEKIVEDMRNEIRDEKDFLKIFEISKDTLYSTNLGFEEQCVLESVAEIMEERRKGVA